MLLEHSSYFCCCLLARTNVIRCQEIAVILLPEHHAWRQLQSGAGKQDFFSFLEGRSYWVNLSQLDLLKAWQTKELQQTSLMLLCSDCDTNFTSRSISKGGGESKLKPRDNGPFQLTQPVKTVVLGMLREEGECTPLSVLVHDPRNHGLTNYLN